MGGHYPKHQERVYVGATLTSNMLLQAKKEGSLHSVTRVRNITASLPKEVYHDVRIESTFQKLTGELFEQKAANTSDEARLDVAARGFWAAGQIAFFDIRVFNSNATSYASQNLKQCYAWNKS